MIWLECSGPLGRLSLRSSRNGRTILCAPQRMPLLPLRFSHAVAADLRRQGHRGFRRVALTQLQYRFNFVPEENRMIKPQLAEFMRRMDKDSVAIIPAAREAVRSHDTNYRYRQNSDFFYLTGFEEPEAIAVIAPSKEKKFTMFVRPRDWIRRFGMATGPASRARCVISAPTKPLPSIRSTKSWRKL